MREDNHLSGVAERIEVEVNSRRDDGFFTTNVLVIKLTVFWLHFLTASIYLSSGLTFLSLHLYHGI